MYRITVGKGRGKSKIPEERAPEPMRFGEDAVTAIGLCAVCLMLLVPVSRDLPDATRMIRAEDKMKLIAPYAAKREMKILLHAKKK